MGLVGQLYVVRHAHAGARGPAGGPDERRRLSDRGHQQARGLRDQLAGAGLTRLIASPFARCLETLAPLGSHLGIEVEPDPRLAEAQGFAGALELASELRDETAVLCSHGDVIPDLLDELVRRGLRLNDELRWPKASTWILTRHDGGFSKARYVPPPA